MTFTIVFLIVVIALIISKTKAIVHRNDLNSKNEKRILISSVIVVLFLITNVSLPYPESLYWFVGLSVVFTSIILSFNVLKKEFKRFATLRARDKVLNVLFYGLLIVVTHISL